jgi:hypothetical protein
MIPNLVAETKTAVAAMYCSVFVALAYFHSFINKDRLCRVPPFPPTNNSESRDGFLRYLVRISCYYKPLHI